MEGYKSTSKPLALAYTHLLSEKQEDFKPTLSRSLQLGFGIVHFPDYIEPLRDFLLSSIQNSLQQSEITGNFTVLARYVYSLLE